jgi:hypothetical protein
MTDFSFQAVEVRGPPGCGNPAVGVIKRLGVAEPFLSVDDALIERSTLGLPTPASRGPSRRETRSAHSDHDSGRR